MGFVEIDRQLLERIATDSRRMPKLYYHPWTIARKFFWLRLRQLHSLMLARSVARDSCLDFACGSGVFLPTLSQTFRRVDGIDLETREAEAIKATFKLNNVKLINADISRAEELPGGYDVIIAADVLEHFQDLGSALARIKEWLSPRGRLFTSLPTESFCTKATRIIGGYTKPWDHYHSGQEVEQRLAQEGFEKLEGRVLVPFFPMYLLGVWRRATEW